MGMWSKKPSIVVKLMVLMTISVMVLAGCGTVKQKTTFEANGAQQDKIKLTIADTISNPVFRVALNKGIFKKYGIEAEIVTFATPAEGVNALFINQVNIAYGADFPILNAVSKGDYSIIAATGTGLSDESAANWKLFVRKEIQTPADLKGKTVSNFRGTFVSYLWDEYLQQNQLVLDDVKIVGQGGFDESYVALKSGEIDAVWVTGAVLIEKFESIEGVHILTDMSQTLVRTGGDIVAPDSILSEHPETIANFIRALDEAAQFIKSNPDEVADIMYKEVKQPKEMTVKDLAFNNWTIEFSQEAFDSLAKQKAYMLENGIIKDDFDLDSKIDIAATKQVFPDRVTYKNQ